MQLESKGQIRAHRCIRQIYSLDGLRGFYRGLSASYAGKSSVSGAMLHFHLVFVQELARLQSTL